MHENKDDTDNSDVVLDESLHIDDTTRTGNEFLSTGIYENYPLINGLDARFSVMIRTAILKRLFSI